MLPVRSHESSSITRFVSVATLVLAGGLAVSGCSSGEPQYCHSPRKASNPYPGDPNATNDRSTWTKAIVVTIDRPQADIIAGFKNPHGASDNWQDSNPVPRAQAGRTVFKLGNGPVAVSVYYNAPDGSSACDAAPAATFSIAPQPFAQVSDAAQPVWPPANR